MAEQTRDYVFNVKAKLDDTTRAAVGQVDQLINGLKGAASEANVALKAALTQGLDTTQAEAGVKRIDDLLRALKVSKNSVGEKDPFAAFTVQSERAAQEVTMLAAKIDFVKQKIQEAQAAGNTPLAQGFETQLRGLTEQQTRLQTSTTGNTKSYGQLRNSVQNASYQITDFMVQVQGGTSAVKSLSQQGSQLLAGFGAWGAAAGLAVTGLTILYEVIQRMRGGSEYLRKELEALQKGMQALSAEGKNFDLSHMRQELNSTIKDVRTLATAKLGIYQASSVEAEAKAMETFRKVFSESRDTVAKGLGLSKKVTPELIEFRREYAAAMGDSTGVKANEFIAKYSATLTKGSEDTRKAVNDMVASTQALTAARKDALRSGQTVSSGEIEAANLKLRAGLEGALVEKVRVRAETQRQLEVETAKGNLADKNRIALLTENLRLSDLSSAKDAESSSAQKEIAQSTKKAAREAEIAAKQHAALINSQNAQLESLRGGINKVEGAAKRLRDIQKLRDEMIKAGNKPDQKIFEQLLADATEKLDTAKMQAYIDSLSGVEKGYALASANIKKFQDAGKVEGAEMQGRIDKLHEIANAAENYGEAMRKNLKAAGITDTSVLPMYDQIAIKLSAMRDAATVSKGALSELTLEFNTGAISLKDYITLWQQFGGTQDQLFQKDPNAYFQNLTDQFERQKLALVDMPEKFQKFAEGAHLTAEQIEGMTKKFPQLASESDKALSQLKSQLAGIAMDRLSDALQGNVKNWREWGAEVLKQLAAVLIKWSLMQAAMRGAAMGGGTWWGSLLGAASGGASGGGATTLAASPAPAADTVSLFAAAPAPDILAAASSVSTMASTVMNMRGTQANPGRMSASGTKVEVNNYGSSQVETERSTDASGMETIRLMIRDQVRDSLGNGSMDSVMRMSYGLRRNPI